MLWPPLVDMRYNIFLRGLKLMGLCIMLCGFYSAVLEDNSRKAPSICLAASFAIVPLGTLCFIQKAKNLQSRATERYAEMATVAGDNEWSISSSADPAMRFGPPCAD